MTYQVMTTTRKTGLEFPYMRGISDKEKAIATAKRLQTVYSITGQKFWVEPSRKK